MNGSRSRCSGTCSRVLVIAVLALAGASASGDPRPALARPATPPARTAPRAAAEDATTLERPTGTPTLETLLAALNEEDNASKVRLPAEYLPVIQRHGNRRFPAGIKAYALVIKGEKNLVGAFLAVVPTSYRRCATSAAGNPTVFWLAARPGGGGRTVTLPVVSTGVFDGDDVEVEFPPGASGAPVFLVRANEDCTQKMRDGSTTTTGKFVELWAVVGSGLKNHMSAQRSRWARVDGKTENEFKAEWVKGQGNAVYFALTAVTVTTSKNRDYQPGHPEQGPEWLAECKQEVTVSSVTTQGAVSALAAAALKALRARDPAIGKLPKDTKSDDAACRKLVEDLE